MKRLTTFHFTKGLHTHCKFSLFPFLNKCQFFKHSVWSNERFLSHPALHNLIGNTDCIEYFTTQNKDMCIVRSKTKYFIGRFQRNHLLPSNSTNLLTSLAVVQWSGNRLRFMINVQMPRAVGNCDEGQVWCTDTELPLLLWSLDIAECVERADMLPPDWCRGVVVRDFRLPDKPVNVVSQTDGWLLVRRQRHVE